VGGSTSVPPEPPQPVLLSRLYRFIFHRYRNSVYGLKVGKNVLRFICNRVAYGIRTNPCETPLASSKAPMMTPPGLMAGGMCMWSPVDRTWRWNRRDSAGSRDSRPRHSSTPVIAPAGLMAKGAVNVEPGGLNVVKVPPGLHR
jgi:hypothetical protein